jgi:hypothetical protein
MLALALEGCGGFFPEREWKVDVLNGDRPLIVSIATHRSASMWLIEPETHVVVYQITVRSRVACAVESTR